MLESAKSEMDLVLWEEVSAYYSLLIDIQLGKGSMGKKALSNCA